MLAQGGIPGEADLAWVQSRTERAARVTQAFQLGILRDLSPKDLSNDTAQHVPPISTAFRALPPLRRLLGRFIGMGVRPEHIAA